MKKRISGRKVGFVILAVLFVLSIADIILRRTILQEARHEVANVGTPLITVLLSALLIISILAKKHRLFYILCGAYLGYFVMNQIFALPSLVIELVSSLQIGPGGYFVAVNFALHLLTSIGIIAISGLLVKYLNDGTIYNKAFNTLCIITVLMFTSLIATNIFGLVAKQLTFNLIAVIFNLSRLTTVFLFAFFAYDTAKAHLARTKLK